MEMAEGQALLAANPGSHFLMSADSRLPPKPEKPTLIDFFKVRFASTVQLLQSATHALKGGQPTSREIMVTCTA